MELAHEPPVVRIKSNRADNESFPGSLTCLGLFRMLVDGWSEKTSNKGTIAIEEPPPEKKLADILDRLEEKRLVI